MHFVKVKRLFCIKKNIYNYILFQNLKRSLHWSYDEIEHKVGMLFQPWSAPPKDSHIKKSITTSKSQKLMLDYGIISTSSSGMHYYLPLGLKSINKLVKLIDEEMLKIGAQKIEMPSPISKELFDATGRWNEMQSELFTFSDRHNRQYCLGPTHEEAVTDLVASIPKLIYKTLPLKLYQITKKYRDEPRPKYGLQRSREFLMKDLYSFDANEEKAKLTYGMVGAAYENLFNRINLKFLKVLANAGVIGGTETHEYHIRTETGEDEIIYCSNCKYGANVEVNVSDNIKCPKCKSDLEQIKAIEVGHTFLLGKKYSQPLNASFRNESCTDIHFEMGCYGLGVTRILAAALEVLSKDDELRWPKNLAPYQICILPPKEGSKEEQATLMAVHLYKELSKSMFPNDVIFDDRTHLTIGNRMHQARKTGYPYIIVTGKKVLESPVRIELQDVYNGDSHFLTHKELFEFFNKLNMN